MSIDVVAAKLVVVAVPVALELLFVQSVKNVWVALITFFKDKLDVLV